MNRRQFIKTSILVLGCSLIQKLPAPLMPRGSWVDDAITLYLSTPDSELLDFEIAFNGQPIETYVIKMFQNGDKFIHEIKIPNIYNSPGRITTTYEAQIAMNESELSLTPGIISLKRTIPAGKYIEPKSPLILSGESV